MRIDIAFFLVLILLSGKMSGQSNQPGEIYNDLLSNYVTSEGKVNYNGFIEEKERFQIFLDYLSNNKPDQNKSINERLAYWINAYNAFTIKLIIDNYPIESITDLHPFFYIPGYNTVWHDEFFKIGEEDFSLDRIEHDILREEFDEPRMHFAINCASVACPVLRNEIYTASKINNQLQDQTHRFLTDSSKNKISRNRLELSKIFSWFKGDFEIDGDLVTFIDIHTEIAISKEAEITFLSYNWSLNE